MTKQELYTAIAVDVLAAMDCAERGESHWRVNGMMARTAAHFAAFNPPCPDHLLPPERRPFSRNNPCTPKASEPAGQIQTVVRIVGTCWEFPDGTRIPKFWAADQKAKSLGMVLEKRKDWRFSVNE